MIGCKEEIVSPLELDIQHMPSMNDRSDQLFEEGCDAVLAADTLISEYSPGDTVLLQSLFSSGYDTSDIVRVLHVVLDYRSRSAESTLLYLFDDKNKVEIAKLILKEYQVELNLSWTDLKYFISLLPEITEKITVLKDTYGKSPEDIVKMLKELGENAFLIIQEIRTEFPLTEEEVLALLLKLQFTADDITAIVRDMFNYQPVQAFDLLHSNGYQEIEILMALRKYYDLTIGQICELLSRLNLELVKTIEILKALNFDLGVIIEQLGRNYDYTILFEALISNGYVLTDVLKDLKDFYTLSISQVAQLIESHYNYDIDNVLVILKQIGFGFDEIGILLEQYYSLDKQEISQYLKNIGASANDIFNFLKNRYGMLEEDIAKILNNINFDLTDMVLTLWEHLNFQLQRLLNIFTSLGYDICDILTILGMPC